MVIMRANERLRLIEQLKNAYLEYLAALRCEANIEEKREQYENLLYKLNSEKL